MSLFRFEINGTIVTEPLGWDKGKRRLVRNKKYKALFLEYLVDLTFDKDGYDLIKSLILSGGYCASITFQVFKRKNDLADFLLHFDGKLILENIKEDETKEQITVAAEDTSLSSIFVNNADFKTRLDGTASIGGSAISLTKRTIAIYDQFNNAWGNRYGYYVFDVFQFLLNYISDNQITLVSNLLSSYTNSYPSYITPFINGVYRFYQNIRFTTPGTDLVNASNTTVYFYVEIFGYRTTYLSTTAATAALTLNVIMSDIFDNGDLSADSTMQKFYKQRMLKPGEVVNDGVDDIEIYSDYKIIIHEVYKLVLGNHVSIATITNADIPETTGLYGYGGINNLYKLSILNINQLRNANTLIPTTSFDELFTELDKCEDLGISLTLVAGIPTLRLEQINYFYQETEVISLQNVNDVKHSLNKTDIFNSIQTKDGSNTEQVSDVVVSEMSKDLLFISSLQCIGNKLNLKNEFIIDWSEIDQYVIDTDHTRDEKILFLESVDTIQAGAVAESKLYRYRIYTAAIGTNVVAFVKNIKLNNHSKVRNWLINIAGHPSYGDGGLATQITINNYTDLFIKEYDIEHPLTDDQFNSINENKFNFITFNKGTDPGTAHKGWVIDISREEVSGRTKLKLLSR